MGQSLPADVCASEEKGVGDIKVVEIGANAGGHYDIDADYGLLAVAGIGLTRQRGSTGHV